MPQDRPLHATVTFSGATPAALALEATRHHQAMGTLMDHRAAGMDAEAALDEVEREIARLERLLSRFDPASEISRVNAAAGRGPQPVSPDTFEILTIARRCAARTRGRYDPTAGPLAALWRAASLPAPPDRATLLRARALVNWRDLLLDAHRGTAALRRPGQSLDLGGIGKGYAADRLRALYARRGIVSACSSLGGNVLAVGERPGGGPWRVGIQHPRAVGELIGAIEIVDGTVVTSGDYRRYATTPDGRRHHHIVDPRTGQPAESGLAGVTVVGECSTEADALATALFVAGRRRAARMLAGYPGAEAVLVERTLDIWITPGLLGRFLPAAGGTVRLLE